MNQIKNQNQKGKFSISMDFRSVTLLVAIASRRSSVCGFISPVSSSWSSSSSLLLLPSSSVAAELLGAAASIETGEFCALALVVSQLSYVCDPF